MTIRRIAPQIVRHGLQLLVLVFIVYAALGGTWRNYKMAHNHRRIVSLIEGDFWGRMYGANEDILSLAGDPFDVSLGFLGFPWSSRVFGIDSVDPILALDQLLRTKLQRNVKLAKAIKRIGRMFRRHEPQKV